MSVTPLMLSEFARKVRQDVQRIARERMQRERAFLQSLQFTEQESAAYQDRLLAIEIRHDRWLAKRNA